MVGAPPAPPGFTREDAERWYESIVREPFGWVVEYDGRCVGVARLHGVDDVAGKAWLAVGLFAPEHRGRGLGTESVRLVLAHAFGVLALSTVRLRVLAFNALGIGCYRRCGFREVSRESVTLEGERTDDILMEVTAADFHAAS